MKWVDKALEIAAKEFIIASKQHIHNLNMYVASIVYKELSPDKMKMFTDEFISSLKYSNLYLESVDDMTSIMHNYVTLTPIKIKGYDLAMCMDSLKTELAKKEQIMIRAVYIEPNDDKIVCQLYKINK